VELQPPVTCTVGEAKLLPRWDDYSSFHTALHSLESFFALRNKHPHDHLDRKNTLLSYAPQLGQQLLRDYLDMYSLSIAARYECISLTVADVQDQRTSLARIDAKVGPLVLAACSPRNSTPI
jgi:hypothetical protein